MKSKILALSKNEEFKNLLNKKRLSNKYVTIFFGILENKNNKRLNISFVTKKKIGNAVKRNKIKRRLRNIINNAVKKISIKFKINNFYKSSQKSFLQNRISTLLNCCCEWTRWLGPEIQYSCSNITSKHPQNMSVLKLS